jgi:oligopeptide transport system ATP-binding protein
MTDGQSTIAPLLAVKDLRVHFAIRSESPWPWTPKRALKAVDGVSFDLHAGETLGIVGESGCGKSTLARALINLVPITAGSVAWHGDEMRGATARQWQAKRKAVQMIFQDPLASLDPRMTVSQIIGEPLRTHCPELPPAEHQERVLAMMLRVGLTAQQINRYPHEFSGGQCQRIGIARALILKPQVVICDEPVSALDVSIQAQIINLLKELQAEMGLALIFIAHDLAVVKHISQRVMVMYLGRAMEIAEKHALYDTPAPSVYASLVVCHSRAGPTAGARKDLASSPRRPAVTCQPAVRVRIPYALPQGGGAVRAFVSCPEGHGSSRLQRLPSGLIKKKTARRRSFSVLGIPDQNSYAADRRKLRAF